MTELTCIAPTEVPARSVADLPYLFDGMRFKISYDSRQQTGKIHGIPAGLGGRWVSFVAAESDCHISAAKVQPARKPLTAMQRVDICDQCANLDFDDSFLGDVGKIVDLVEAAHGIKGVES